MKINLNVFANDPDDVCGTCGSQGGGADTTCREEWRKPALQRLLTFWRIFYLQFNYKKGEYETFENSSKNDFSIRAEAA